MTAPLVDTIKHDTSATSHLIARFLACRQTRRQSAGGRLISLLDSVALDVLTHKHPTQTCGFAPIYIRKFCEQETSITLSEVNKRGHTSYQHTHIVCVYIIYKRRSYHAGETHDNIWQTPMHNSPYCSQWLTASWVPSMTAHLYSQTLSHQWKTHRWYSEYSCLLERKCCGKKHQR